MLNDAVRMLDETARPGGDRRAPARRRRLADGAVWLIDLIGIDVHVHAAEALQAALPEERLAPPPRLRRMVEAGPWVARPAGASTTTVRRSSHARPNAPELTKSLPPQHRSVTLTER